MISAKDLLQIIDKAGNGIALTEHNESGSKSDILEEYRFATEDTIEEFITESRVKFRSEVKANIDIDDFKYDILSFDNNMMPFIKSKRKLVVVITPFLGDKIEARYKLERYAKYAVQDSFRNNEAPMSSQSMYLNLSGFSGTNVERDASFVTQLNWLLKADIVAFYIDYGVTKAMESMMNYCTRRNIKFEIRMIGDIV